MSLGQDSLYPTRTHPLSPPRGKGPFDSHVNGTLVMAPGAPQTVEAVLAAGGARGRL